MRAVDSSRRRTAAALDGTVSREKSQTSENSCRRRNSSSSINKTALGNNSNTTWKQQQSQQATFVNPLTNCSAHIAHTQRVHFHFERAAADLFLSFVSFFQALVFVFLFSFYDSQMAINFPCNEHAPRVAGSPAEAEQARHSSGTATATARPTGSRQVVASRSSRSSRCRPSLRQLVSGFDCYVVRQRRHRQVVPHPSPPPSLLSSTQL